ncbi:MAG TPA: HlyD family efflux transporter periplasmic adaptor subunit, partial [Myxococcota bacterium]|nr:HlyD family efflux transporter periplasmic adaptor subunit [Myxococcota bacterium]
MRRRLILITVIAVAALVGLVAYLRSHHGEVHFTGFVEGEERILRSEVAARVLEVRFAEGDVVPPDAVVAQLDDAEIEARIHTKQQEIVTADADIARQEEQLAMVEQTWKQDLLVRQAEVRVATATADLAQRTLERKQMLLKSNVASQESLDEARSRHDETRSAVDRAHDMLARAQAEERQIAVAQRELEVLRQRRELAAAQLEELRVVAARYQIHAPQVGTVLQTQLIWPGELAQPGTPVASVLDPEDKYVQIYVPVADVSQLRVGQPVEIELDSELGTRTPGEVSFVADKANF